MAKERDRLAEGLMDTFEYSVKYHENDLDRMCSLQNTYDNVVNKSQWSTISQIPLATAFSTVERATADAMSYLFPSQPVTRLLPMEPVDDDSINRMEWAMHVMMKYRMRSRDVMFKSIKDTFKVSVGYGIVEPFTITPPASFITTAGDNETRIMGPGVPVQSLRYRYISPGKIVPYPSGTDFNGPDPTPVAFFLDMYSEQDFRDMVAGLPKDGDTTKLMGSADEMVEEARTHGFNSGTSLDTVMKKLSGRYNTRTNSPDKGVPVMVPVLKCYQEKRHTWLFCGNDCRTIYDVQGTFGTMRKPLIKWDAWQDSDRWFPMSLPEADERTSWAKNLWFNAIFDLMSYAVKRPLLWDSTQQKTPPKFGPTGTIGIPGDVRTTARFLDPPGIGNGDLQMGGIIDGIRTDTTGQRDLTQHNFNRGGAEAFQALVQSSSGQEYIRNVLLQMSGLESAANQVLLYMQMFGDKLDLNFQRPSRGSDGDRKIEYFQITEDDLQHGYSLSLDLESKRRVSGQDINQKLATYDRKIASGAFDNYEVARGLCMDEEEAQREVLPREVVQEKQRAEEAAQQAALAQGGAQGAPAPIEGVTA